jgi:AraC-like DNA-binding protein
MSEGGALTFSDPDAYAAAFDNAGVKLKLTITGAGDFKARLIRLKLKYLEVYRCSERLPRIAYISLPSERIFLSLPVGKLSPVLGGFALRNGSVVFHARGERVHQCSSGECQWGLISLSADQLESCSKALIGHPIASPQASTILQPSRAEASRFHGLFKQAYHLAETGQKLIKSAEVARALEQELLHAVSHCLSADETESNARTRHHHAAMMVRFEEMLSNHIDQKINMPTLCTEIGVAERTLRMCCSEFLGVSPTRYLLLQRLNKARSALRRANPSTASVAEVARNHQFLELGRFAVTYRTTFGESPSATLQRDPQA